HDRAGDGAGSAAACAGDRRGGPGGAGADGERNPGGPRHLDTHDAPRAAGSDLAVRAARGRGRRRRALDFPPMSAYGLSVFCLVYAFAVASPGPGVAAVVARALGRGVSGAPAFIAGFLAGDLIWFTLAATGLAMLAQPAHTVFVVVRYAGAAYLLYLAWRLWTTTAGALVGAQAPRRERPLQLFMGTLALTLGNPKTQVFFLE